MSEKLLFEEKQYLGDNYFSLLTRLVLALFCFTAYYWSQNPKPVKYYFLYLQSYPLGEPKQTGQIFFITGISILLISIALMFVLHTHIKIYENYILVDGFWGTRRVVVDMAKISKIRKSRYKNVWMRRPVFNLHKKNVIRFYTCGKGFIEITYENGITYKIGTQKPAEVFKILKEQIVKCKNLK